MTEKDFNTAFSAISNAPLPPAPDPSAIAVLAVARDQRRTWILTVLSLLFWLIATSGILLLVLSLDNFVMSVRLGPQTGIDRVLDTQMIHRALPWVAGSVGALMLAAVSTVLLILSSRQAVLNRINISLWQIAEQMKKTGNAPPPTEQVGQVPPLRLEPVLPRKLIWSACIIALLAAAGVIVAMNAYRPLPWQGYPIASPFQAIRWSAETPEVELNDTWYEPLTVDDVPVSQIIAFSKSKDPSAWQKHFDEDLVELMIQMGHHPGPTVDLQIKNLTTGEIQVLSNVPMTETNRWAIWRAGVQPAPTTQP